MKACDGRLCSQSKRPHSSATIEFEDDAGFHISMIKWPKVPVKPVAKGGWLPMVSNGCGYFFAVLEVAWI